jgi:hypothetical protein
VRARRAWSARRAPSTLGQLGEFGFDAGPFHDERIARGERFDFGVAEGLVTDVVDGSFRGTAGHDLGDQGGFAFDGLPSRTWKFVKPSLCRHGGLDSSEFTRLLLGCRSLSWRPRSARTIRGGMVSGARPCGGCWPLTLFKDDCWPAVEGPSTPTQVYCALEWQIWSRLGPWGEFNRRAQNPSTRSIHLGLSPVHPIRR